MIQETYCSFEQAKALKELGFPQGCYTGYYCGDMSICFNRQKDFYARPTLSLVQKWLREEKNLYIIVYCPFKKNNWEYDIDESYDEGPFDKDTIRTIHNYYGFKTYEQALSAGIDKCIELLKEK